MADSRKASTTSLPVKAVRLDEVLVNELGQFGKFQILSILLVAFPILMCAFPSEYIFSAAPIPHRCRIPECGENSKSVYFGQDWLSNAIPETSGILASCERFQPTGVNGSMASCPASIFNQEQTVECDGFVYARNNSVVYDFDLGCNEWLRTLAGTIGNLGNLVVLPITGYFSDRFGRRHALIISLFNLALFGFLRAFSINYSMYLVLHFLQRMFGGGTYSSAYIFATELVGPRFRVLTSATCSSMFAVGQVLLGSVAWLVQPWRHVILAIHVPGFLIISYYWLLSDSVRWLLSKQKFDEARVVLEKVARVNKTHISEKSMRGLLTPPPAAVDKSNAPSLVSAVWKSPVLLRRVCTTPIWWITTTFVYYGLSINSIGLSDTMYLNYILTCAIEIPGFFSAVLLLDKIGKKTTLSIGYFLSAACNLALAFISPDLYVLRLILYLLGKFSISTVVTGMYLFTSELYPTEYRHNLLAFASMLGRIGSITAPLTPALMVYWNGIPSILFGALGLLSGFLVLTQPETLGTKMPDTLAEAEALGTPLI